MEIEGSCLLSVGGNSRFAVNVHCPYNTSASLMPVCMLLYLQSHLEAILPIRSLTSQLSSLCLSCASGSEGEWGESCRGWSQDPWQPYLVRIPWLLGVVFSALLGTVESHRDGNFEMRVEYNHISWNKMGLRSVDEECLEGGVGKRNQCGDGISSANRQD